MAEKARIWTLHQLAGVALEKMTHLGERHGIEILPVKGVVNARRLYDDVSERPMQDVDVRVTRQALGRLRDLAPQEGLKVIHDSRAYENLVFDMGGIMLEVEARIGPPGVCAISIDDLLRRAVMHEATFGFPCLEPELHDHALLLTVNAFKDKMIDALPWALRDLDRIVREKDFSPERFAALTKEGRVTTLAWIVASWLEAKSTEGPSQTPEPAKGRWPEILAALGTPPREAYARWMLASLKAADAKKASFVDRNTLRIGARASSDSLGGCARALGGAALHAAESALGLGIELK